MEQVYNAEEIEALDETPVPISNDDCQPIVVNDIEPAPIDHELFLGAIPDMFETLNQKFLMSHFLWGHENTEKLLHYLRLYDLLQRIYRVKIKENPDKETILNAIKSLEKNERLYNTFCRYIDAGRFPTIQRSNSSGSIENL
jgi:hypothetical protein